MLSCGLVPARLFSLWDSPGKNMGVGCHVLLEGIFLTQGLNLGLSRLLHCQADYLPLSHLGFPGGSVVKNLPADAGDIKETQVRSLGWEDPLEEDMAPHSRSLAWKISMDRRAWRVTVHEVAKSQT